MKRILPFLLILSMIAVQALSDPLPLREDYANVITRYVDENDHSAGSFEYSYRYPHVDEEAEGGASISMFYRNLVDYLETFTIPMDMDNLVPGDNAVTAVTYTVTCNNDEYFSVLIQKECTAGESVQHYWQAHVFSRAHSDPEHTYSLPKFLGILSPDTNDAWLYDRQTKKANTLIRELVWDMIRDNEESVPYFDDYLEEYLIEDLDPEQDYYLDENGDPVFFINPGYAAPESEGLLLFPIPLEDILDEL